MLHTYNGEENDAQRTTYKRSIPVSLPDHIIPKWEAAPTRNAFRSTPYGETTKTVARGEVTFTAASINTDKSTSSRLSTRICISTMCHALCATPRRETHSLCYPPSPFARVDGSAPIMDISWRGDIIKTEGTRTCVLITMRRRRREVRRTRTAICCIRSRARADLFLVLPTLKVEN